MIKDLLQNIDNNEVSFIQNNGLFNLSSNQRKLYSKLINARFLLIKKARRVGASTIISHYIAKRVENAKGLNVLVITPTKNLNKYTLNKIEGFIDNKNLLPSPINQLSCINKSRVKIITEHAIIETYQGVGYDLIFIDEFAFFSRSILEECIPMLKTGGQLIIASTPNGNNYFYDLWVGPNNIWDMHDMPMTANPKLNDKVYSHFSAYLLIKE